MKSSDDTHKEKIKVQNAEQITCELDKYWEDKDKVQEAAPEANPEAAPEAGQKATEDKPAEEKPEESKE